ncbi:MAG TPA: tRNA (guanosine(37)-N1)-methyltransferase TrmD [Candidatus Saccharimonadales bacterium]|nr:tRNA (guanosine(37)-N1)-methyltransferase TrmD [Candidatus Saccharimonadales bacterium]
MTIARERPLRIAVVTIFPELVGAFLESGVLRVARECGALQVRVVDLRDFTRDRHRTVDDAPFGGGPGMVLKPEPIFGALESLAPEERGRLILLSPQGQRFDQELARELAAGPDLALVAGHYKAVDERVNLHWHPMEVSLGDYVLSGGELAAGVVMDCVARLLPGVLSDFESAAGDSFFEGLLDCAYYTRPAEFRGMAVPEVLLSGNHARIERHRRKEALRRTLERRPELLEHRELTPEEKRLLAEIRREGEAAS